MYKFSDVSESERPGEGRKMTKGSGCYVSATTGIIIALLAIVISVGVGLIVHFAENRALECNFPVVRGDDGSVVQAQSGGKATQQQAATTASMAKASKESTPCPTLPAMTTSVTSTTSEKTPTVLKDIRLPKTWKPTHYILNITPQMYGSDPSKFTFEGHVKIEMNCTEATSNVTLHINQLTISSPRFGSTSDSNSPNYQSHTEDTERQFLIIQLDKSTQTGKTYFIDMDFVGPLKDDMKGFYLSSFKQGDKTVYAAATQFEPTDARKAFPCFDEPQLKATFEITLVRKKHIRSVSNMPISNSIPFGNDMIEDHYETSRTMSTYLVAFVIGDFDYTAANTSKGLLYRAWATPDSVDQTHTALDVGVKTIVNYENYFDIDFPLQKQDMIAVPELSFGAMENWGLITYKEKDMLYMPGVSSEHNLQRVTVVITHVSTSDMIALPDMPAGAMENWGLITYRQTAMLFQPGISSERNLQRVTTTITHEVAHQWFGDLVTMRWWDDLWLNEGFTRFVEDMGADFIHPDWKMFEQFVVDVLQKALAVDGLVTSHPIYVPVNNPDEINEIFDTISYSKGASVIRMMRFVLGDETFRRGIQLYLKRLQYQNAFHDDLWQALTEQSATDGHKVNVKDFMDTWILQMNYPVVKVTTRNDRIFLRQSRFLSDLDAKDPGKYTSPFGYKWKIPFTYTSSNNPRFSTNGSDIHWLNGESSEISHPGIQSEDWVLGNIQQLGFYRVAYEDDNWIALVAQLKSNHKAIHTINRAQIINDAWSLARARQLSTAIALGTLEYLDTELEYVPWAAAQRQIGYLHRMLSKTDLYGQFQTFMKNTLTNPFKHYGMDDSNSSHIETYIRSDVAKMACSYGITECITKSKHLFKQWMDNPSNNNIDPDLRDTVYCTAISGGGSEEWDFAYNQFKIAKVASEKATIMKALACTKSTWLLSRYLNLAITPTEIRKQDAVNVMVYISQTPVGQALTWDFVRANWNYLMNAYGNGVLSFTTLLSGITTSFNTEFQLSQLQDFLAKNPYMGTGARAFQQAIEKTQTNIKWMKQNKQTVSSWLQTVKPKAKSKATDVRLPGHLIPRTYDLTIQPNMYGGDPENFNFEGHVKIVMEAAEAGSNVTLHTNKLTIDENTIKFGRKDGVTGGPVYTGEKTYDEERQFEIFSLDSDVTVGEHYFIEMNFTGPLTGDLTGLYLSQYQRGNETVYLATTQFESTDARKAFPCFDEPEFKAAFNVKLVRKSHLKSLSNMPIIRNETLADDFVADIFDTSKNMSTYLVCMIICDFEFTEATTAKGVRYRAWARPESINQTFVALDAGVKIIDYYADYFGIDYPLPKEDMIALPDFRAGAMENWGLITYRETAMLYEEGVSSETNLQRVDVVIAHELAHMWFGDLVTMDWWDDLWLNEGFATFVEYMGVDYIHPDWKMFEQFIIELYDVFDADSLVTSHPIYVPVNNPVEIKEIFDAISYGKGSLVIRMMRFFLSDKVFQEGVQIYLKNREYSNANHNDLWDGLGQAAKKKGMTIDVRGIMDTWILQMNYPVVMVTKSASGKIMLQQKRFLSNPDAVDPGKYPSPYNYTWQVPFTYTKKNGAEFSQSWEDVIWLEDKEQELADNYPLAGDWILGNIQQFGVYRVNYEESNWQELIKQLKTDHKVIHTINRGQIINDAFGLAKTEELAMTITLQTVEYLQDEEEYVPWVAASGELGFIDKMLLESEIYGLFQTFMRKTTEKQFRRLGLNDTGSDHLTSLLRSWIANKACGYGNAKCESEAKAMFGDYMKTKINTIDPGVRGVVYCTALRTGGEKEWDFIFEEYKTATVAAEKSRLMSALLCTRQPWLLYRMLDLTFQEDVIRKRDAYLIYGAVGTNEVGTLIAWNFFRGNWDRIFQEFGLTYIGRIISAVTSTFNTEFLLQEMKDFKTEHPDMGRGTTTYSQAIESVEANILWMKKNYRTVKGWLETMII